MGAMLVGAIVGAIVGAVATFLLTRLFTRDPAKAIAEFQQRIEALEQERSEADQWPITMQLRHGGPENYVMYVQNESEEEITIEAINIEREDVPLSTPSKPQGDDCRIPPHSAKEIWWSPQSDPVATLRTQDPNLGRATPIPVQFLLVCRIRGKSRVLRRTRLVTADYSGLRMTDYGP